MSVLSAYLCWLTQNLFILWMRLEFHGFKQKMGDLAACTYTWLARWRFIDINEPIKIDLSSYIMNKYPKVSWNIQLKSILMGNVEIKFRHAPKSFRPCLHKTNFSTHAHNEAFSRSMISGWPASVSAFPLLQMMFLLPPSIHATSIFRVSLLAEWR